MFLRDTPTKEVFYLDKKEFYTGGVATGVTILLFPQHIPIVACICLFMTIICAKKKKKHP